MMKHTMIIAGITIALMAGTVSAKDYYKWVDDKGVTRYAEQAPVGVQAEKINTYSGSSTTYDPMQPLRALTRRAKSRLIKKKLRISLRNLNKKKKKNARRWLNNVKSLPSAGASE